MKNLTELIERISGALNKDSITRSRISQVVLEKARVRLDPEKVFVKNGVLEVSASSAAKTEIRLKEEEIILDLKKDKIFISRILYK